MSTDRQRRLPPRLRLLALAALAAAGCAPKTAVVSGTVTFGGEAVTSGSVVLYCADKQIVRGLIDAQGQYTIPNVPYGTAVVTVQAHARVPTGLSFKQDLPPSVDGPTPPAAGRPDEAAVAALPRRYGVPEESGLKVVVDRPDVTYDIPLKP